MAGGTDLLVQKADEFAAAELSFLFDAGDLKGIRIENGQCILGAAVTASEIAGSPVLRKHFPGLENFFKLISSTPVRNMGTLGGNLANASPIGDLSIFFLALDAQLMLGNRSSAKREIPLKDFFKAYKELDLREGERIERLRFRLPGEKDFFNFEKVSKRAHLDIASVNTAIRFSLEDGRLFRIGLSAGGVAPVPLFLSLTAAFLEGRELTEETLVQANAVMQDEISPISDIRGSESYKRLLLRQLFYAHFWKCQPEFVNLKKVLTPITGTNFA